MGLINKETNEYIRVSHSDEFSNQEKYTFFIEEYVSIEHRKSGDLMKFHPNQEMASDEICKKYTGLLNDFSLVKGKTFRESKIIAAYTSIKAVEGEKWEDSI